jgi:hypothetical protein
LDNIPSSGSAVLARPDGAATDRLIYGVPLNNLSPISLSSARNGAVNYDSVDRPEAQDYRSQKDNEIKTG